MIIKGTIQQYCKTLEQAESIQEKLYEKYDSVQLVSFPTTQEDGIYVFRVEKSNFYPKQAWHYNQSMI